MACDESDGVNSSLGEAYSSYWDVWLTLFAADVRRRYPEIFLGFAADGTTKPDPLSVFSVLYNARGAGPIFEMSWQRSRRIGFDVANFLLLSAHSAQEMARRWQRFVAQQAQVRLAHETSPTAFLDCDERDCIVLQPYLVKPANLRVFGPAMMGGVAVGTFQRMSPYPVEVFEVQRAGATRRLLHKGRSWPEDICFDSQIVIRFAGGSAAEGRSQLLPDRVPHKHTPMADNGHCLLSLNHLAAPGVGRFVTRLTGVMRNGDGRHVGMDLAARRLGLSTRSLSRRLKDAELGYAKLSRFVRLRTACIHLAQGDRRMDEVAFLSDYADRHHMARDFRRMAEVTPTGMRDILER